MNIEVEVAIKQTKEYLSQIDPNLDIQSIDFSYITQELINQERRKKIIVSEPSSEALYCYKGHHYFHRDGVHYFTNGNPSVDSCDQARHKCIGGWHYEVADQFVGGTVYGSSCPRGTEGHGTIAWEGEARGNP